MSGRLPGRPPKVASDGARAALAAVIVAHRAVTTFDRERDLLAEQRRQAIRKAAAEGLTFRRIGDELGLSAARIGQPIKEKA